ncbi:MAG: hypothetical protein ACP5RT_03000 [Candidatus Micrarchaeia archaeon]
MMSFRRSEKERIEAIIEVGTVEQKQGLISEVNKLNIKELKKLVENTDETMQTSLFDTLISTPKKLEKMLPTFVEYGSTEMRKKVWEYVKDTVDQSELLALLKSHKIAKGTVHLLNSLYEDGMDVEPRDSPLHYLLKKVIMNEEDEKSVSLLKSDMAGAVILMLLFDKEIAKDFLNWINDPALLKFSVSTLSMEGFGGQLEVDFAKRYLAVYFATRSDEFRLAVLNTIKRLGAYDIINVKDSYITFEIDKEVFEIGEVKDVEYSYDKSINYLPLSSIIVTSRNEKVISKFLDVLENVKNRDKLLSSKLYISDRFYEPDFELAPVIVKESMKATCRVADIILEWAKDNPSILNSTIKGDIPLSDIVNITGQERQKYYDRILGWLKDNPHIYVYITIPDEVYIRWLKDNRNRAPLTVLNVEYFNEIYKKSTEEYIREWAEGSQDVKLSLNTRSGPFSFADIVAIIGGEEGQKKLLPFINTKGTNAVIDAINKYGTPEIKEELTKNLRDGKTNSNIIDGIVKKIKRN